MSDAPSHACLRVVVIEDEALVAMLLEDMIQDTGHQVTQVLGDVPAALEYVGRQAQTFDVAILDVNLSGQPSFPIAEALRDAGKAFVFSTGYGREGLPEAWRDRPVLSKPFGADAVTRVLEDLGKVKS